jgi:hypothetical protein
MRDVMVCNTHDSAQSRQLNGQKKASKRYLIFGEAKKQLESLLSDERALIDEAEIRQKNLFIGDVLCDYAALENLKIQIGEDVYESKNSCHLASTAQIDRITKTAYEAPVDYKEINKSVNMWPVVVDDSKKKYSGWKIYNKNQRDVSENIHKLWNSAENHIFGFVRNIKEKPFLCSLVEDFDKNSVYFPPQAKKCVPAFSEGVVETKKAEFSYFINDDKPALTAVPGQDKIRKCAAGTITLENAVMIPYSCINNVKNNEICASGLTRTEKLLKYKKKINSFLSASAALGVSFIAANVAANNCGYINPDFGDYAKGWFSNGILWGLCSWPAIGIGLYSMRKLWKGYNKAMDCVISDFLNPEITTYIPSGNAPIRMLVFGEVNKYNG